MQKKEGHKMTDNINEIRKNTQVAESYFSQRLAFTLGPVELKSMLADKKVKLVDVRAKEDFDEGHIPEAISIPKSELKDRLHELSMDDVHVVYCYNAQCHLAAAAAYILAKYGYAVMELEGGFKVWVHDFKFETVK